jgi:predicted O-methyltransferase YrrM
MTTGPDIDAVARAFTESRTLLTAIELDVFSAVKSDATAGEAAAALDTDPRATEALLNALAAMGFLTKNNGRFRAVSEFAERLAGDSANSEREAMLHTVNLWDQWSTLTQAVRTGTRVLEQERTPEQLEAFIAAMHRGGAERAARVAEALDLSDRSRALDVGGGSGAYSIALARAGRNLHCVLFDLEDVTAIARRHIADAGLSDRITTQAGDFHTDSLGSGYDLVLISQILHMLSPKDCAALLEKSHDALVPGGMVVIQDFILDDDKTAPRRGALFALNMLVATREGSAYSGAEYVDWLRNAGFEGTRIISLPGLPTGLVTGTRK